MTDRLNATDESLLRDLAPQVLAAVIRRFRDFAAAEDAVQEALVAASVQWPKEGLPDNPCGWLIHVAARRMTDHVRSESARRQREALSAAEESPDQQFAPPADAAAGERDDTLVLLFMCCHPSLTPSSAIALTLRAVGGLTTAEIANAFLVPESTMAQRISRAKQTIKASRVPFRMPGSRDRASRLGAVLHVLYLIFNEGYATSIGATLQRVELSSEAIRLTRALHRRLADDPEVAGLLALMLLTDARRPARTGSDGELIPLDKQDRRLWDRSVIAEGTALISRYASDGCGWSVSIAGGHRGRARRSRRDTRRRTGRRFLRSTRFCSAFPTTRWSRSIARWPSRWCTAPPRVSTNWLYSKRTQASRATIGSMP